MDRADAHSFIGIMVPRQQASDLGRLQTTLRSTDGRFDPIPRRWLNLTLDDLGTVDPAALEAAALACARVVEAHPPFALRTGALRRLGSVVALMVDDPDGRLTRLRAALHEQLRAYGFTLDPRPFSPHIALGRGAPTLDITAPTMSFKIHTVRMLTHVPPDVPGLPWDVRWRGDLTPIDTAAPAVVSPADRDAEIRAELEARVLARAAERAALRERQARAKPEPSRPRRVRPDRAQPDRAFDEPPQDRLERDRSQQDGSPQDRAERDRSQRDRSQQDRSQRDRSQQDRSSQSRGRGDRPQTERPRRDRADRPLTRTPDGPPDERADANAPRPKRRRRRRRPGGRSTPQPPKESS